MITEANVKRIAMLFCAAALSVLVCGCAGVGQSAASASATSEQAAPEGASAYFDDWVLTEDEVSAYTDEFRKAHGYEDDASWAAYLQGNDMTGKTWRESVIREKADKELMLRKAKELGITADESAVAARIEADRANAGIEENDDEGWRAYLEHAGQTPEGLEESYEYSSIQSQVFNEELDLSAEAQAEMCNDFIKANLADQVVRHYYAIGFDTGDEQGAQVLLTELKGLSGDELTKRFVQICEQRADANAADAQSADEGTGSSAGSVDDGVSPAAANSASSASAATDAGSIGWDFLYNGSAIDPDNKLRKAKLQAGELYAEPLKGTDGYRVVLCMEREELVGDDVYGSLQSESLKALIADLSIKAHWTALLKQYMADLEKEAGVQVTYMPEGLSYDVVD